MSENGGGAANQPEAPTTWERYDAINKPGGDHHFFYKNGWGSW
ncbi:hypothetical protein [Streptomyces sp. NPDC016845]